MAVFIVTPVLLFASCEQETGWVSPIVGITTTAYDHAINIFNQISPDGGVTIHYTKDTNAYVCVPFYALNDNGNAVRGGDHLVPGDVGYTGIWYFNPND